MRGARTVGRLSNRFACIRRKRQRCRGQPHDAAVARRIGVGRTAEGIAGLLVIAATPGRGNPDVEALRFAAPVAVPPPAAIRLQLMIGVEPAAVDQALCQTEGHAVSSVHWPGCSENGPPPTMSLIGLNGRAAGIRAWCRGRRRPPGRASCRGIGSRGPWRSSVGDVRLL